MSETTKPKPRWRKRIAFVMAAISLLAVMGVVRHFWTKRAVRAEVDEALAETDRLDPGWRTADLLKKRRHVADADNSALIVDAAVKAGLIDCTKAADYDTIMEGWGAPKPLTLLQRQFLRGELAKMPKALALLRQIKDYPNGSFPLLGTDLMHPLLPHLEPAHAAMDCLRHDAILRAEEESTTASLESCLALLNTGRALQNDPFLVSQLGRDSAAWRFAETVEWSLARGEATPASLSALQAAASKEAAENDWLHLARLQRATLVEYFLHLDRFPMERFQYQVCARGPLPAFIPVRIGDWMDKHWPASVEAQIPAYLHYENRFVEAAKLPIHEQPAALAEIEADRKNQPNLTRLFSTRYESVGTFHLRSHAALRCCVVALACERYRMQHKAWPDSLGKLVEAKLLDAVPLDPCDGKPLRYRRTAWGVVVYSVGHDVADDGGFIDRTAPRPDTVGLDLGVRLWDVPRRKGGVP